MIIVDTSTFLSRMFHEEFPELDYTLETKIKYGYNENKKVTSFFDPKQRKFFIFPAPILFSVVSSIRAVYIERCVYDMIKERIHKVCDRYEETSEDEVTLYIT